MNSKQALDKLPEIMLAKNVFALDEISNCFNIIYKDLDLLEAIKRIMFYLLKELLQND